jgi:hypothetical protein
VLLQKFNELVERLAIIKDMGYINTHRAGSTGIGKTLEDLLGIPENNIPSPNGVTIELKATRKNAKSMITLFTKSPMPRGSNSILLERFGYPSKKGNNRRELQITVNSVRHNTIKDQIGLLIAIKQDRVEIIGTPPRCETLGYYDRDVLSSAFQRKLPMLLFVRADSKGIGLHEEFWFNEAWLLSGFSFENFLNLLKSGDIVLDIRIGQYPNGRPHDHGTGFRVQQQKLDLCFSSRRRLI